MGVPHFFKYLIDKYPNILCLLDQVERIDHLFFDTNCLIHPCCAKVSKEYSDKNLSNNELENKMLEEITKYIIHIINLVCPQKTIYISIDGPAPRAKMQQQRLRRYKSSYINNKTKDFRKELNMEQVEIWDTNAITPGTKFMSKLNNYLSTFLKKIKSDESLKNINIIFIDSNVPGEGEHKIIDFLRKNKNTMDKEDSYVNYGLDADLIFLSLTTELENFYLLREKVFFNNRNNNSAASKEHNDVEFNYLSLDLLKFYFQEEVKFSTTMEYDTDKLIKDFIFLCFLIGNDFLPNLGTITVHNKGIDKLLGIYYNLLVKNKYYLVHNNKINLGFLIDIFQELSLKENDIYKDDYKVRRHRNFVASYEHNDKLSEEENKLNEMIRGLDIVYKKQADNIRLGAHGYEERYYSHYFNLNPGNIKEYQKGIDNLCELYIRGLYWNFEYYFKGSNDFEYYYPHVKAPLTSDLYDALVKLDDSIIEFKKNNPPKPITQLFMVLPPSSSHLVPTNMKYLMNDYDSDIIQYYPLEFDCDMINKRYFHECVPYLPVIDYKYLKNLIDNHKISANDKKQNVLRKEIVY